MVSLRVLLALLIAFALPAQALADARIAADCCPMSAAAPETLSSGPDCCHEHDADGVSCEAGSCCPCGAVLALTLDVFVSAAHERAHAATVFSTPPYPAPPDAHWRPPAVPAALI